MSPVEFPKGIPEKLRTIRERTDLMPDDFASHVNTPSGVAVIGYENGTDIPVSVLFGYAKLGALPIGTLRR